MSLKGALALSRPRHSWSTGDSANLSRCSQGLLSLLLSFKVKPYIRYLASSEACASLARELSSAITTESQLFTFNKGGGNPLLIIMDRKEDPVTPLLTQFTYQAMVHELIPGGINANRVNIKHFEGISKDMECVFFPLPPPTPHFFPIPLTALPHPHNLSNLTFISERSSCPPQTTNFSVRICTQTTEISAAI